MGNLMAFLSAFASYIIVFLIFCVVAFCGVKIGITLRKNKDAKTEAATADEA